MRQMTSHPSNQTFYTQAVTRQNMYKCQIARHFRINSIFNRIVSNFEYSNDSFSAVSDAIRTSLGPRGMDKMVNVNPRT